jgi:hypothetical protein
MVPIDELRAEANRLVSESTLWDKRVFGVQVTDWKTDSIEIRILVSAATAGKLFDLRCEIREKLLTYLQQLEPSAFPRVRNVVVRSGPQSDGHRAELRDRNQE